jgi:hypothetical protein
MNVRSSSSPGNKAAVALGEEGSDVIPVISASSDSPVQRFNALSGLRFACVAVVLPSSGLVWPRYQLPPPSPSLRSPNPPQLYSLTPLVHNDPSDVSSEA